MIKRICVFCGSSIGQKDIYRKSASLLGKLLVERGYELVYGGGQVGLMGIIANSVLEAGGQVTGVIPKQLASREVLHPSLSKLFLVSSMHERKAKMNELSDAFIALPGGFGTFEELFEVVTWAQLGIHTKPIGILNIDGYYQKLFEFLDHAFSDQFIHEIFRSIMVFENSEESLLDRIEKHRATPGTRWVLENET